MTLSQTSAELEVSHYLAEDGFGYGFVLTYNSGVQSYYIRNDRAILDWFFEPVPDEEYTSGIAFVALPEGYFYWGSTLFYGERQMPYGLLDITHANKEVAISETNPVQDKALHVVLGSLELDRKEVFEAANLPIDKVFYLDR